MGYKPWRNTTGTFVFTVELRKGKKLQWALAHIDDANYVLFQMDKKFFYLDADGQRQRNAIEESAEPS